MSQLYRLGRIGRLGKIGRLGRLGGLGKMDRNLRTPLPRVFGKKLICIFGPDRIQFAFFSDFIFANLKKHNRLSVDLN